VPRSHLEDNGETGSVQLSSAREAGKRWRYNQVGSSAVEYYPAGNDVSTKLKNLHCYDPLPGNG
jgi:hypothetical protein